MRMEIKKSYVFNNYASEDHTPVYLVKDLKLLHSMLKTGFDIKNMWNDVERKEYKELLKKLEDNNFNIPSYNCFLGFNLKGGFLVFFENKEIDEPKEIYQFGMGIGKKTDLAVKEFEQFVCLIERYSKFLG